MTAQTVLRRNLAGFVLWPTFPAVLLGHMSGAAWQRRPELAAAAATEWKALLPETSGTGAAFEAWSSW